MVLTSTDAGAAAAPLLDLYRNSASPAASDTIGEIEFNGQDSAGNKQQYALIHGSILSPTSTAETGQIHFETATGGASTEKMIIGTTNLVINDIGAVFNVRIEGDTDANLFFTDATNSRVGIGIITPAEKLDVVGNIKLSGNVIPATAGKGIDFSANTGAAGMTSELLNWYEEGTWTPIDASPAALSFTSVTGNYIRVGKLVTAYFSVTYPTTVTGNNAAIGGLPFTSSATAVVPNPGMLTIGYTNSSLSILGNCATSATSFGLFLNTGSAIINSQVSTTIIRGIFTYIA
jgi:hypothetical protein